MPNAMNGSLEALSDTSASRPPRPLGSRRAVLTHLTADTSWLIQFHCPSVARRRQYYNILLDPWLAGRQTVFGAWFLEEWHLQDRGHSAGDEQRLSCIKDVEDLIWKMERDLSVSPATHDQSARDEAGTDAGKESSCIDVLVISHEFTDHCHEETLRQVDSGVPVFAPKKALSLINSFKHFSSVQEIPSFRDGSNWKNSSSVAMPLAPWLRVAYLPSTTLDFIGLHSALLFAFEPREQEPDNIIQPMHESAGQSSHPPQDGTPKEAITEALIYSPHGVPPSQIQHLLTAQPPIQTLALLHGLNDVKLAGIPLNLGAESGAKVADALGTRYWIATHDEEKGGKGIVHNNLKITVLKVGQDSHDWKGTFVDMERGETITL